MGERSTTVTHDDSTTAAVATYFDAWLARDFARLSTVLAPVPVANWMQVQDGKSTRIRVAFDPRASQAVDDRGAPGPERPARHGLAGGRGAGRVARRAQAIGLWSTGSGLGMAAGPVVG